MTRHAGLLQNRSISIGVWLENLVSTLQDVVFRPEGVGHMVTGHNHEVVPPDGAISWVSGFGVVDAVLSRDPFRPPVGSFHAVYQDKFLSVCLFLRVDVDDSRRHDENRLAANPPGSNPMAVGVGKGQLGSSISTVTSPV